MEVMKNEKFRYSMRRVGERERDMPHFTNRQESRTQEEYSRTGQQGHDTVTLYKPLRSDSLFLMVEAENSGKCRRNLVNHATRQTVKIPGKNPVALPHLEELRISERFPSMTQ
jgi:hypothetical protein